MIYIRNITPPKFVLFAPFLKIVNCGATLTFSFLFIIGRKSLYKKFFYDEKKAKKFYYYL